MTKTKGFKIRVDLFLPIDKKDFAKQAATYQLIADIQKTGKVPAELLQAAHILSIDVKDGSAEIPAAPAADSGNQDDPALTPLTTDPLPDGAIILESSEALDLSVIQTIKLADGTETMRRISAEQDAAEIAARAANAGGKKK